MEEPTLPHDYEEGMDLLYRTAVEILACITTDEEEFLHKHNVILLLQLY